MNLDLLRLGQGCRSADEFERKALEMLRSEVGFEVGFLSILGREATPTALDLEQRLIARAVENSAAYAHELGPVKQTALARRGVAVDTDVLGATAVSATRYFREIASEVGGRHSLFAYLRWQGRPFGVAMLGRSGQSYSAAEVAHIEAVLPALSVTRAAFGLPRALPPMPNTAAPPLGEGVLDRLFWRRTRVLATRSARGGSIVVRDRQGYREMVAKRGQNELVWTRASLPDGARSGWPYVDLFHVAASRARRRERALFIGCGGGVAIRQFVQSYAEVRCDVVECDPVVVELAQEFFGLGEVPRVTLNVADGGDFVASATDELWDVVVVDAFDTEEVDATLVSRPFFREVRRVLRPGGALALNVIGVLGPGGVVERAVRIAEREFSDVRVLPVAEVREALHPNALRNVVVVGTRKD